MPLLYSLAWSLALPIVIFRLWLRSKQEPGYRQHIAKRLDWHPPYNKRSTLWVLAVSAE